MAHKPLKMSLQEYKKETFVEEGQFVSKAMHYKSIHKTASIISDSSYATFSPIFKYQTENWESFLCDSSFGSCPYFLPL